MDNYFLVYQYEHEHLKFHLYFYIHFYFFIYFFFHIKYNYRIVSMCSIAGARDEVTVWKMLTMMRHRSPDDEKIVPGDFCVGMGRLSIIDIESGGLCAFQDDGLTTVFNGEIYNYIELREELKSKGHFFRTTSDIEVLSKSWKEWGIKCLDKFNGMFAFAVYDGEYVFLARDIAGEKPLYYTKEPFMFASEAKALGFDCEELPPASYLIFNTKTYRIVTDTWWEFSPIEIKNPEEELEALLEDSIRLRTRSDVPYGIYLSDGVDSNLISTFHEFENKYTYKDNDYRDEFKEVFPKILWHLDYPIKSFSAFPLWKLAEEASKSVKVVISGEGADELFGGYVRFIPNEFNRIARKKFPSYETMFPYRDMMWEEFNGNMRELLRMGDRMSAAWGIENRCPFLDRRIIEFAFSLPIQYKISGIETKIILRNVLKKRKPEYKEVEKHGLYAPIPRWLGEEDRLSKSKYIELQKKLWDKKIKFQSFM